jgi:hypothetical protein
MKFRTRIVDCGLSWAARLAACLPGLFLTPQARAETAPAATRPPLSVLRVNVTNQKWDFIHPWAKRAPFIVRGLGAVLAGNRVLVTAEFVANASYVELEKPAGGEKIPASVERVDYEANLALVKPSDPRFLDGVKPLAVQDASIGDRLELWQLENTGALLSTSGRLTTVEVGKYPIDDTALLLYRLTAPMQYRESSFTLPVVKDGKLAGMLMRYDQRAQNADTIPAPVIAHFLKDATGPSYGGFPRAGMEFCAMRDPQLRHYAGLNGTHAGRGVYVAAVHKNSAAEQAGLRAGDVILAVNGKPVDQDGNYADPRYGKLAISHLISTQGYVGDPVKLRIFRAGREQDATLTLSHPPVEDSVVEPFVLDRAPRFCVLGGLLFQELSRQYLKEWNDWQKKAPERLVYYDRYQAELFQDDRKKIIILSQVLPTENTVGYEDLAFLVVSKINQVPLKSFADLAEAIKHPVNGFHKIEFEDGPGVIYLDAEKVAADNEALMKNYRLPSLQRLE